MPDGALDELYVESSRYDELVHARRIRVDSEAPNVLIRVPRHADVLHGKNLRSQLVLPAAVAVDLLDAGDERSVRAAHQLLANLGTTSKVHQ